MNPATAIQYRNMSICSEFLNEIIQNLYELHELDGLPISTVIEDIFEKEQQETVDNMLKNTVCFHKTCRDMINKQKVERARAKHEKLPSPIKTRCMSAVWLHNNHRVDNLRMCASRVKMAQVRICGKLVLSQTKVSIRR